MRFLKFIFLCVLSCGNHSSKSKFKHTEEGNCTYSDWFFERCYESNNYYTCKTYQDGIRRDIRLLVTGDARECNHFGRTYIDEEKCPIKETGDILNEQKKLCVKN